MAETERDLKEKLEILSEILNNYISDMEAYITPENPGIPMRVDRSDIWWNYIRISQQVKDMGSILWDTGSSFEDYHRFFVYNIFEDEEENNRRRESMEEEENAERRRRVTTHSCQTSVVH